MSNTLADIRFALRQLTRTPVFTLVAVATLALGIGANSAIFSLIDALVLRPLPIERPEQLVWFGEARSAGVTSGIPTGSAELFSLAFFRRISEPNAALTGVAAMASIAVEGHGRWANESTELERMKARLVSGNLFAVLGVKAGAGRLLNPGDDRPEAPPVAVLSDRYWEKRFRRSPDAVGRTVELQGNVYTVIGVSQAGFSGVVVGEAPDLYVPLSQQPRLQAWIDTPAESLTQFLHLMGRRREGVSTAAAGTVVNGVFRQWLQGAVGGSPSPEQRNDIQRARIVLTDAAEGVSLLRREFSQPLRILLGVVALVLLIGCANLANLQLARATGRRREMAVRLALGANRRQLVRQVLTESLALALMGGLAAMLLAAWATPLLLWLVDPGNDPIALDASLNLRVLAFTFSVSLLTAIAFGAAPAWQVTRVDAAPSLKEGKGAAASQRAGRLGPALVAGQVCLALLLVTGAGLFLRTLANLQAIPPGFSTKVVVMELSTESAGVKGPEKAAWARRLEQRVQALPGVRSASFSMLHFGGGRWGTRVWPAGAEKVREKSVSSDGNMVGTRYFETMGLRILRGRSFRAADTGPQRVALVNETLASRLFPNSEPVGRRFQFRDGETFEVIGVASNTKVGALREEPRGLYWLHNAQIGDGFEEMVVRAEGDPRAIFGALREAVQQENPNVAIARTALTEEHVQQTLGQERLLARLTGFFGLLALALSALGIYGLLAYRTGQRTSEFGIRMALGASAADVLRLVMTQSLRLLAVGLLAGIPAALLAGRLIADRLYGVTPYDASTLALAAALLLSAGLLAAAQPAWRAARIQPMRALRDE